MKKIIILYDATPGFQLDPEAKKALDVFRDVEKIGCILKKQGFQIQTLGLDFPIIRKIQELVNTDVDLVFNLCEGLGDESAYEIHVASLLELMKVPFTGSGSLSLAFCHNKAIAKALLNMHGMPTPNYILVEAGDPISKQGLEYPLIVKPVHEDGSFGIDEDSVVHHDGPLKKKVSFIHEFFRQPAIVEEFIDGREFNVSILGNDPLEMVKVREICFSSRYEPRIVSFDAKWKKSSRAFRATRPCRVEDLPQGVKEKMIQVAIRCHEIFKMKDYGRIDFRLGKSEIPYVIDLNPNPCISADSGMALAAVEDGILYEELIGKIASLALSRENGKGLQGSGSNSIGSRED
ncbi:MAG: ATP-grasp domain-containing protein [Chlamydiae bacterium]|nr:ATP-grasp domain-containing protein [Chlamydiota bacterium]MBI3265495.1 ATP-grasp domain-containing protein [Chlamydiota bacterium]